MAPSGFIAILAGWFVTEVGRQPYTAYGVIRTTESISPVIAEQVAVSLAAFVIIYTAIFGAGVYYMFKVFRKGPSLIGNDEKGYYDHSMEKSVTCEATKDLNPQDFKDKDNKKPAKKTKKKPGKRTTKKDKGDRT